MAKGNVARDDIPQDETVAEKSAEIARIEQFDDAQLRAIVSIDDAFKLAAEVWGEISDAGELIGSGFTPVPDGGKARLVDVPFIVLNLRFNTGDFGEYASAMIVTQGGDRLVLNDGSTGIYYQFRELVEVSKRHGGWMLKRGLRESVYATCTKCGMPRMAEMEKCNCGDTGKERAKGRTYYLAI